MGDNALHVVGNVLAARRSYARPSGSLFAIALLAFLLPFGTVGRGHVGEASLTGTMLVTRGGYEQPAALALVLTLVAGLVLGAMERSGGGWLASVGLVIAQCLGWLSFAGGDRRVGFGLMLVATALGAAGLLHLVSAMQWRRANAKVAWHYPVLATLVMLPSLVGAFAVVYLLWFFEIGFTL
jgi:hypothetical protein